MQKSARKKLLHFFWRTLQSLASWVGFIQTKQCSFRRPVVSIHATKIAPYPCIDVNLSQLKRHYFVLSAALFILQNFKVYFAIFCSAMKRKTSEKVMAWTFLATEVIFIVVLTLMTFLLWWAMLVQTVIILLISRL